MLAEDPAKDYPNLPKIVADTWRRLTPLTVQALLDNGMKVDLDSDVETSVDEKGWVNKGQFNFLGLKNGVARSINYSEENGHQIHEGFFKNGQLNGYGRIIYNDGHYYIGMYKDG